MRISTTNTEILSKTKTKNLPVMKKPESWFFSLSVYTSKQFPIHSETRTSTLDGSIRSSALDRNTVTTSSHLFSFTSFSVCSATELASTAYTCREHNKEVGKTQKRIKRLTFIELTSYSRRFSYVWKFGFYVTL